MLALATAVVAVVLGFGAVQELVVRGLRGGETLPLAVGFAGALVSALLLAAALALWRRWAAAPRLAAIAGGLSVAFHAYAALPPHRNVGPPALLLAVGVGLALVWASRRRGRDTPRDARAT